MTSKAAGGGGEVGLGAAVSLSQAASGGMEVDEETKIMIRQTAEWFHANPDKSKVGRGSRRGRSVGPSVGRLF